MYDRENIRNITDGMDWVRPLVHNDMSDGQRRLIVVKLREIATELDCLKPVDAIEGELVCVDLGQPFPGRTDASLGHDHGAIPAAPGPEYATRKELEALRASVNGADFVTRDFVLNLVDRVVRLEEDILGDEHVLSLSGRVLAMEELWQAIRSGAVGGTIAERWQKVRVGIEASLLSGSEGNCHYLLDEIGALIGDCKSGVPAPVNTIEPDQEWQRQHLYNQAYLAALPAVVRDVTNFEEAAAITARIATQSMEYLK